MKVVAQTEKGYLIEGTKEEIVKVLSASLGTSTENISIGQKIPAIDYAGTIRKFKALGETYEVKALFKNLSEFVEIAGELKKAVENAKNLEL